MCTSHKVFKESAKNYMLTDVDVASRHKVARVLRTSKMSKVTFVFEALYKKGGVFEYPKVKMFYSKTVRCCL